MEKSKIVYIHLKILNKTIIIIMLLFIDTIKTVEVIIL